MLQGLPQLVVKVIKCFKEMSVVSTHPLLMDQSSYQTILQIFFEKAVIEVLGGTEIEPSTQTHQTTKIVKLYTTVKPEDALYKYQNLGGYEEKYDST